MNKSPFFEFPPHDADEPDRRLQLLADLTLQGLSDEELAEIEQLQVDPADAEPLQLAAA